MLCLAAPAPAAGPISTASAPGTHVLHFSDLRSCARGRARSDADLSSEILDRAPFERARKKYAHTPLGLNTEPHDVRYFGGHGRTVRSMRPSVRHPRIHTNSRHAADRSLQSLWFVDAREPQPVPSPSGQRHSATVVNCRLVQLYIRPSDLEPDSKRLPCHVPRSTGCSSRMRDEYMYDMMNCDELLARTHQ